MSHKGEIALADIKVHPGRVNESARKTEFENNLNAYLVGVNNIKLSAEFALEVLKDIIKRSSQMKGELRKKPTEKLQANIAFAESLKKRNINLISMLVQEAMQVDEGFLGYAQTLSSEVKKSKAEGMVNHNEGLFYEIAKKIEGDAARVLGEVMQNGSGFSYYDLVEKITSLVYVPALVSMRQEDLEASLEGLENAIIASIEEGKAIDKENETFAKVANEKQEPHKKGFFVRAILENESNKRENIDIVQEYIFQIESAIQGFYSDHSKTKGHKHALDFYEIITALNERLANLKMQASAVTSISDEEIARLVPAYHIPGVTIDMGEEENQKTS